MLDPQPLSHPLGDLHHTDFPPTAEDERLGAHLAYYMGDLFLDSWKDSPRKQWTAIARALRTHGLQITNQPADSSTPANTD